MDKSVQKMSTPAWAPVRANSVANQIVEQVREALFAGKFQTGDLIGSEKDLARQFDVSRITVRDALRTLETMGIVEIRVGAGGGARIAEGNLDHFSDALAIQFKLAGVTEHEILDVQVAIESTAAELAALNRSQEHIEELQELLDEAEAVLDDPAEFTNPGQRFHLAIVEASGNRALVAQFKALRHVIWPQGAKRAKREIAAHAFKVHQKLFAMIEEGDSDSARKLMVAHLSSIRAVAFPEDSKQAANGPICC
ncbi:MAG: FadR/GntR family transcriptional regulator [Rhodospirillales bacterium]